MARVAPRATGGEGSGLQLERERELEALEHALDRLGEGVGSLLMVEGPAGIGKTRLLAEAAAIAERAGASVHSAAGGELERGMAFGVARQLLEAVVERAAANDRDRLLAGSAGLALAALQGAGAGAQTGGDPYAPLHGLYWLVSNIADGGPVVLVVDDAQWADGESLRWLHYLSRRLEDLPVAVIAAARSGEPDEPAELDSLRELAAELLHPKPLSPEAVTALVGEALRSKPAPAFSSACGQASKGNPFYLTEILRMFEADDVAPDEQAAESVTALGPDRIASYVLIRLGRFGEEAIALARSIAVLGASPQLRHSAALAGLDEATARDLCDRLREAEILDPGFPLRFVHPLVRAAIERQQPEAARSASHRRAAEVLHETGAEASEIAAHLPACAPNGDQWVVAQLREAAHDAMAAGGPDAARQYLERALLEPPDDPALIRYELGRALWGAAPLQAPEVLAMAAEEAGYSELELLAVEDTAWTYFDCGNLPAAVQWLERLAEIMPAAERDRRLALEANLFSLKWMSAGRTAANSKRIANVAAGVGAETRGELLVRQALMAERFMAAESREAMLALARPFPPPPWAGGGAVPALACKAMAWSGNWDEAREATARGWESAETSGLMHIASYRESFLAEIDRIAGRLTDSEAEARTALHIVEGIESAWLANWSAVTNLLATLIARGEIDEAGELARDLELSARFSQVPMTPVPLEIRALLRLGRGELSEGAEDLLQLGEDLEGVGILNPAPIPWRQEAAPALAALDRSAEAATLISVACERARTFGAPHVVGIVLRAQALIQARKRQIETLGESVKALEEYGPPHELARSLLELGAALRRDGRRSDSREPLRRALELAHRSGAGAVEVRAREELAAVGSRPRSVFRTGVESLTASELRTSKLAAEGLSNVEIAQRLFVSRKTVEKHLGNAYMKLEIGGREELAAALDDPDG